MTTEGVLESKSIFDKCCLELKNTLENMWGGTNIWNFEVWPLSHRTLMGVGEHGVNFNVSSCCGLREKGV